MKPIKHVLFKTNLFHVYEDGLGTLVDYMPGVDYSDYMTRLMSPEELVARWGNVYDIIPVDESPPVCKDVVEQVNDSELNQFIPNKTQSEIFERTLGIMPPGVLQYQSSANLGADKTPNFYEFLAEFRYLLTQYKHTVKGKEKDKLGNFLNGMAKAVVCLMPEKKEELFAAKEKILNPPAEENFL